MNARYPTFREMSEALQAYDDMTQLVKQPLPVHTIVERGVSICKGNRGRFARMMTVHCEDLQGKVAKDLLRARINRRLLAVLRKAQRVLAEVQP